ncbi:hypothetical protein MYCTH_2308282 [Thermothelomyces thermophilus ATCC 42464]|uniref:Uncharacterized protein n=1 Tax=Thermothelomyces thermophilus (strain ATCC 42464 / BCRC 31852 / DSM 1799) TaxID=573729 RepID=G2QJK5_THET4|nr:uncharacterized protein MYCTH_2308282 [Thermothelomyces thermophilus ATCC 42464]AEO59762.1 hypothetical protein MYCTH_2308282 [Thermothelomyces thermophilus ATCC 42464]
MAALPPGDFHFFPVPGAPINPPPIVLTRSTTWTYCGPLLTLGNDDDNNNNNKNNKNNDDATAAAAAATAAAKLPPTFAAWSAHTLAPGSAPLLPRLVPFLRATHVFLRRHGVHHYWLTLRASKPTHDFDTARWHTDDDFFEPPRGASSTSDDSSSSGSSSSSTRIRWKLCGTLQGPGTLFAAEAARPHACAVVRCAACGRRGEAVREEARAGLAGARVAQTASGGAEIAFFRLGEEEGAVHSEPPIDRDRVFVNVVPGTEADLRALMARWGMEFPRSWTLGVPVTILPHTGDGDDDDDAAAAGGESKTEEVLPSARHLEAAA